MIEKADWDLSVVPSVIPFVFFFFVFSSPPASSPSSPFTSSPFTWFPSPGGSSLHSPVTVSWYVVKPFASMPSSHTSPVVEPSSLEESRRIGDVLVPDVVVLISLRFMPLADMLVELFEARKMGPPRCRDERGCIGGGQLLLGVLSAILVIAHSI